MLISTVHLEGDNRPKWEETFVFNIDEIIDPDVVRIGIYDKYQLFKVKLGETFIDLTKIREEGSKCQYIQDLNLDLLNNG